MAPSRILPVEAWTFRDAKEAKAFLDKSIAPKLPEFQKKALGVLTGDAKFLEYAAKNGGILGYTGKSVRLFDMGKLVAAAKDYKENPAIPKAAEELQPYDGKSIRVDDEPDKKLSKKNPWMGFGASALAGGIVAMMGGGILGFLITTLLMGMTGLGEKAAGFFTEQTGIGGPDVERKLVPETNAPPLASISANAPSAPGPQPKKEEKKTPPAAPDKKEDKTPPASGVSLEDSANKVLSREEMKQVLGSHPELTALNKQVEQYNADQFKGELEKTGTLANSTTLNQAGFVLFKDQNNKWAMAGGVSFTQEMIKSEGYGGKERKVMEKGFYADEVSAIDGRKNHLRRAEQEKIQLPLDQKTGALNEIGKRSLKEEAQKALPAASTFKFSLPGTGTPSEASNLLPNLLPLKYRLFLEGGKAALDAAKKLNAGTPAR